MSQAMYRFYPTTVPISDHTRYVDMKALLHSGLPGKKSYRLSTLSKAKDFSPSQLASTIATQTDIEMFRQYRTRSPSLSEDAPPNFNTAIPNTQPTISSHPSPSFRTPTPKHTVAVEHNPTSPIPFDQSSLLRSSQARTHTHTHKHTHTRPGTHAHTHAYSGTHTHTHTLTHTDTRTHAHISHLHALTHRSSPASNATGSSSQSPHPQPPNVAVPPILSAMVALKQSINHFVREVRSNLHYPSTPQTHTHTHTHTQ